MLVSIYIILLVNEYVIDRTYVIIICDNRIIYLYILLQSWYPKIRWIPK